MDSYFQFDNSLHNIKYYRFLILLICFEGDLDAWLTHVYAVLNLFLEFL